MFAKHSLDTREFARRPSCSLTCRGCGELGRVPNTFDVDSHSVKRIVVWPASMFAYLAAKFV